MACHLIGIIGGMGPAATTLLMDKIIKHTAVTDDSDHIPMIVDNNPNIPSRIAAIIEGNNANPGPILAAMAFKLQAYGAKALAMPCNTAHYYSAYIVEAITIPFLNMLTLSTAHLQKQIPAGKRIGILASPAAQQIGIFDQALTEVDMIAVYPQVHTLLPTIKAIKQFGVTDNTIQQFLQAVNELQDYGTDCYLVACSESSLMSDLITLSKPVFDTLDILADAVITFSTTPDNNQERH